jgi:hypothetical protein
VLQGWLPNVYSGVPGCYAMGIFLGIARVCFVKWATN